MCFFLCFRDETQDTGGNYELAILEWQFYGQLLIPS